MPSTRALACIQGLADSAPAEAIPALRGPLTEALKDVQQDQDRPRTSAAAEALSGLLASSSSYIGKRTNLARCWHLQRVSDCGMHCMTGVRSLSHEATGQPGQQSTSPTDHPLVLWLGLWVHALKTQARSTVQMAVLHFAGGEASAWSEWLQPLLQQAIQAAPLEFSSLWACCVRFAVHSLSESGSEALGSLLDCISTPIDQGEPYRHFLLWLTCS